MAADSAICGAELWTSDGTSGGTVMVLDINSGASGSTPRYFRYVNGTVLFAADDGSHGVELWKSDGTGGNTALVLDINSSGSTSSIFPLDDWAVVGNTLYFVPDDGTHGYELWKSDGTTGGTVMVKDINPGGGNGITHDTVSWFTITEIDGAIYFRANDGTHGSELWKTDGTSAGTGMFQDIYAGASSGNPRYITKLNDQLFFSGTTAAGIKLWSVDPRVSDLYYTDQWQVAEERINGVMTQQNIFSPVYVDAVVLRDRDLDGDGQVDDERLYPMHDANFNVTGVVDAAGDLVERYFNDTYGAPTVLDANWSADGDGVSDVSFIYLHQGGRYDATTKMYHFRRREYDPSLGRWTSPDPMGYVDGMNLYGYLVGSPLNALDPEGTQAATQPTLSMTGGNYSGDDAPTAPSLKIKWQPSQDGYIVQHVTVSVWIWNCDGTENKAKVQAFLGDIYDGDNTGEYWEYWTVQKGIVGYSIRPGYYDGNTGLPRSDPKFSPDPDPTWDDNFQMADPGLEDTYGYALMVGNAAMTSRGPDWSLNPNGSRRKGTAWAEPLPSTFISPPGGVPPGGQTHWLSWEWYYKKGGPRTGIADGAPK